MIHLVPLILVLIATVWTYQRHVKSQLVQKQNNGLELARHLSELFIDIQRHKSLVDSSLNNNELSGALLQHIQNQIQLSLDEMLRQINKSPDLQAYQPGQKKIKKLWQQIKYRLRRDITLDANNFLHTQMTSQVRKLITDLLDNPTLYWTEPSPVMRVVLLDLPSLSVYLTQARDAVTGMTRYEELPPYSREQLNFIAEKIHYKLNKIAETEKQTGLSLAQLTGKKAADEYVDACQKLVNKLRNIDQQAAPQNGNHISEIADSAAQSIMNNVKLGILSLENAIADGYPQLVTNRYFKPFELRNNLAKCNAYAVKID